MRNLSLKDLKKLKKNELCNRRPYFFTYKLKKNE